MNLGTQKTLQTLKVSVKTWLLRSKKMKDGPEPKSSNAQRKWNNKGRVHDGDDDGLYWSISFDKERHEDEEMVRNSDNPLNVSPASCGGFKKPSNGRTMREFIDEESRFQTRIASKAEVGSTETVKKVLKGYEIENPKLKDMKIDEIVLKNEKRRRKSKKDRKVNAHFPRTLNRVECRITALENMKMKEMKRAKPVKFAIKKSLDSFAMVKSSFDPEGDFRESMMEMMIEKGMRQREELVELLACYLTLNCDEYHHVIVKVFKQTYNQFVNM